MTDDLCYVYEYSDPRNGRVFYVGMGKGNRYLVHMRAGNLKLDTPKSALINEILNCGKYPLIRKVIQDIPRHFALLEEKRLIALYGRNNLTNKTSGGQGCAGVQSFKGKRHSEEARNKMRLAKLGVPGKKWTPETRNKFLTTLSIQGHPFKGKTHSEEARRKISNAFKDIPLSTEQKKQRSSTMKDVWEKRKRGIILMPDHSNRREK